MAREHLTRMKVSDINIMPPDELKIVKCEKDRFTETHPI